MLQQEEEDKQRAKELLKVAYNAQSEKGWKLLGIGVFRHTYLSPSGKFVYKIPFDQYGFSCNRTEHQLYRDRHRAPYSGLGRDKLARCRLAPSGVLVMELVKPHIMNIKRHSSPGTEQEPPEWSHKIDTAQVGLARDGQWKVYDFGNE